MDYHPDTAKLIDRMCRNVEREDFVLAKDRASELLLQTYDLFNLPRPKRVVWCKSPFSKKFQDTALTAGTARTARTAWTAGTAWTALDYDFDYYVFEYEYCKANTDWNENDKKYLDYCELLMQAKEAGAGYRVELDDVLYIAPTPLVKLNAQGVWHSDRAAAIKWKDTTLGETYLLHGVTFPKDLWTKVVSKQMPFADILKIVDIDQRKQAMKYGNVWDFVKHNNGKELDTAVKIGAKDGRKIHYWLYEFPAGELFNKTVHYALYEDSMLGAAMLHMQGVPPSKTVAEAMSFKQSDDFFTVTPEEWESMVLDVDFT